MISVYTKQEIIIKSYREGQSQRSISRELQINRKTVNKYIKDYEAHLQANPQQAGLLGSYLSEPPVYKRKVRTKHKLSVEIQEAIDKFLEENAEKKSKGLRKQLLKNCDIHEQLNAQGFDIGYTTVCNYIRAKVSAPKTQEAFIRQQYQPGEVCEFDWGEIKLYINDELTTFQLVFVNK